MEVLKLLPRNKCRECGEPTCMVFAIRVPEGPEDHIICPVRPAYKKEALAAYHSRFRFD